MNFFKEKKEKPKEKLQEEKKLKREKRKADRAKFGKKHPVVKAICVQLWAVIIVGVFVMSVFSLEKYINTIRIKDTVISEIETMVKLYKDKITFEGDKKVVNGFDVERDTLPFANFGSQTSPGGNCEGYNTFELLSFEGKLNEFLGENAKSSYSGDLKDIELFKEDVDLVYSFKEGKKLPYYDYIEGRVTNNYIDYNLIVKRAYGYDRQKTDKIKEDIFKSDFKNNNFKGILEDITYIQKNKGYVKYESVAYNSINPKYKLRDNNSKYAAAEINFIKESIDTNKLMVVSILNEVSGHSLLAYGYEKIDDNNYRVYVKDSNFPIIKKSEIELTEDDKIINNEIKENFYILFTKDVLKNRWSFIYQPILDGKEIYGYFNSFVPGTTFNIYSLGI